MISIAITPPPWRSLQRVLALRDLAQLHLAIGEPGNLLVKRLRAQPRLLFAEIIAQACNLGAGRMARGSDLSAAAVGWTSEWYLRHETLEAATARIVDHQSTIALARRRARVRANG